MAAFVLAGSFFPSLAHSQNIRFDEKSKAVANQFISAVYEDIVEMRGQYPQLNDFNDSKMAAGPNGVYKIDYKYELPDENGRMRTFAVALTVLGQTEAWEYSDDKRAFEREFPLLRMKIAGYQKRIFGAGEFDLLDLVEKHEPILSDQEQKRMPLQLSLRTLKGTYKVKEDIGFLVTLRNVSDDILSAKTLGGETLFFKYKNRVWGAQAPPDKFDPYKVRTVRLKPGDKIEQEFVARGFQFPEEFEIKATYNVSFQGVNPIGTLKVKVVP